MSIRDLAELILRRDEHRANSVLKDLTERAVLAHDIRYCVQPPKSPRQEPLLLTGDTGFLGSHILAEMLRVQRGKVSCMVRAPDNKAA